jgi:hypothetical protein
MGRDAGVEVWIAGLGRYAIHRRIGAQSSTWKLLANSVWKAVELSMAAHVFATVKNALKDKSVIIQENARRFLSDLRNCVFSRAVHPRTIFANAAKKNAVPMNYVILIQKNVWKYRQKSSDWI